MGKYEELLQRGGAFAEIIRNYLENEVSDDTDPETEGKYIIHVKDVTM